MDISDYNLSRVARGKVRASKIVMREASVKYLNRPKKRRLFNKLFKRKVY
jgi:hypothetical protein